MRKVNRLWAFLALFFFSPLSSGAGVKKAVEYETYVNVRFNFSIKYPKDLLAPRGESANGDGNTFVSKDQQTTLLVWGRYNAVPSTWAEEYQSKLDYFKDTQVTYKAFKQDSFVISGLKNEKIFYYKEISVLENGGKVFLCLQLEYPKKDKEKWDAILRICTKSLRKTPGPSRPSNGVPKDIQK